MPGTTEPASKARERFADILNRAAYGKERVVIERRGKRLAAVVPVEDLDLLEEMEDRRDSEEVAKALEEMKRNKERLVPWKEVRKRLRKK